MVFDQSATFRASPFFGVFSFVSETATEVSDPLKRFRRFFDRPLIRDLDFGSTETGTMDEKTFFEFIQETRDRKSRPKQPFRVAEFFFGNKSSEDEARLFLVE